MPNINVFEGVLTKYSSADSGQEVSLASANSVAVYPFEISFTAKISSITVFIGLGDGSNLSDIGIYDTDGNLIADVGAQHIAAGAQTLTLSTPVILGPGTYLLAFTSAGTTLAWIISNPSYSLAYYTSSSTTSGGSLPSSITIGKGWDEGNSSPFQGYPPVVGFSS